MLFLHANVVIYTGHNRTKLTFVVHNLQANVLKYITEIDFN